MSVESLTSTHTVDIYPLTKTPDAAGSEITSLGTRTEKDALCRRVPMSREDARKFDQRALGEMFIVLFSTDKSLTTTNALAWDNKVFRVREYKDSGGVGYIFRAVVEHFPQIELTV